MARPRTSPAGETRPTDFWPSALGNSQRIQMAAKSVSANIPRTPIALNRAARAAVHGDLNYQASTVLSTATAKAKAWGRQVDGAPW
jgi:hypothetical protein